MTLKNFYIALNVGLIICTLIETYIFPFSMLKWMIIMTKYGGITKIFKSRVNKTVTRARLRFKYNLTLLTVSNSCLTECESSQCSHLNVVIEDDYEFKKTVQLSFCGQDCRKIPPALWKMYGGKTKHLDLSYNNIETLRGLEQFSRLEELILDNNQLGDSVVFPHLTFLRTLSLNNNQITDLEELVNKISRCFPNLSYLSLLSNKACPNQLSDIQKDDSDYQRYRYFVIYKLPGLQFLDSRRVSPREGGEARARGQFTRVRRPPDIAPPGNADRAARATEAPRQRPLPVDLSALGKHKGVYGKCQYRYTGKHSEGNRFILNSDL